MTAKIYYDNDVDLSVLKDKTVAILGYGSQGHAQAQNLRDSGCNVIVGQRPGSANYDLAVSHGFEPLPIEEATKRGDLVNILLPDEVQADLFRDHIRDNLQPGNILMCSHGFNIHYDQVAPPDGVDALLIAPTSEDASEDTFQQGLAYAKGIGGTRGGVMQTTFAEETETDLFGEQVVLCGGVSELVKAAFDTLVEAGYQPEMAYFECLHELKLIVDLFYQGGISYMRYSVSNTAEYGDYTRGPRIVNEQTRAEMKKILTEIQNGEFARDWILENRGGAASFKAKRRRDKDLQIEDVGRRLRRLMSWIDSKEV